MKNRILEILTLVALLGSTPIWASQSITVFVKGMVCDFCVRGLTKGFSGKASVSDFKIELAKHTVTLNIKEGATLSDAEIIQVVEDSAMVVDRIVR